MDTRGGPNLRSWNRNTSLFWTVVGSVAGVIAAGAAVYALFTSGPAPLHLLACCELELEVNSLGGVVSNDNKAFVTFETSSEPVVLTGEVYFKLPLFLDYRVFELGWHKIRLNTSYTHLRNMRIEANSSRRLLSGQVFDVSGFDVRESALHGAPARHAHPPEACKWYPAGLQSVAESGSCFPRGRQSLDNGPALP